VRKHFPTLPRWWIGLTLLLAMLFSAPAGYGLAQGIRAAVPDTAGAQVQPSTFLSPLTPTPSPIPTPTTTPTPAGTILGYHTVQPGETLFCIGRAYGVDPYAIARQNNILNPNLIHAGTAPAIPNAPCALPPGRVCPRQFNGGTPTPPTCRWYHTVVRGENLYRISLHYSVSMYAIAEANHILNLNLIFAGQVLCIP
jgi:LysM repeat protein